MAVSLTKSVPQPFAFDKPRRPTRRRRGVSEGAILKSAKRDLARRYRGECGRPARCRHNCDAWGLPPVSNVFHQKTAFADAEVVIDRRMPFSIDLDGQNVASGILTYDVLVHTITSLAARNFPYTTPTETTIAVFRT
jgi:hypothetical protein